LTTGDDFTNFYATLPSLYSVVDWEVF
jgi:hypothetical protein